jgi:lysophospholipase L1-like esterase
MPHERVGGKVQRFKHGGYGMKMIGIGDWRRAWRGLRAGMALAVAGMLASCEMDVESEFGKGVDFGGNDPNLIAALGDSITAGYGVGEASCYVSRLAGLTGKRVLNFGVGGAESGAGAAQVGSVLGGYKPGVLLIFYGANDIIHGKGTGYTIGNLRTMIRAARANKTIPIVATLTPTFGAHRFMNSTARTRSQSIRDLAREENCLVAEVWNLFGENSAYILDDGLHPNASGHALIAQAFWEAMQ